MKVTTQAVTKGGTATTTWTQLGSYYGKRASAFIQNTGAEALYVSVTDPDVVDDINLATPIQPGEWWEPYRAPVGEIAVATAALTTDYVYLID